MPYFKRCEIKNTYEKRQFEWKFANFFSIIGTRQQIEHIGPYFSFGSISYCTHLTRYRDMGYDIWNLNLTRDYDSDDESGSDVSKVECILGFKKTDGSSLLIANCYKEDDDFYYSFSESELMERKHEFTTSDSLTITCTLRYGTSYYPQPKPDQPMKLIKLDLLSENFQNMFTNKGICDVNLQVKNKVFNAHKGILMARSPVFSAMFQHDMTEKQPRTRNIPDCDPETFQKFLQYLYCGKLEDISFQEVLHLYSISDKFNVMELKCFCAQYMEQCLTVDNVCDIILLAEKNDEVKLMSLARRFFCKNSSKIVNTPKWKSWLQNYSELVSKLKLDMTSKV